MASVYLVYGSCDDIEGVFSTRELADECAKRIGGDVSPVRFDDMPDLPDGLYGWFLKFVGGELVSIEQANAFDVAREGSECWEPTNVLDRRPQTRYVSCRATTSHEAIELAKGMVAESGPDVPYEIPAGCAIVTITKEDILADGNFAYHKRTEQ